MNLSNSEINATIDKIKNTLNNKTLATELEVIIKHLPTYNKIIKNHIVQLKNVLALDNHKNKNLESINLPSTIKQLIEIFDKLKDTDLEKLEGLLVEANAWKTENPTHNIQNINAEVTAL